MADSKPILALNRFDAAESRHLPAATASLLERRHKAFGAASVLFYREPLHVVRAEGVWVQTADGRRFLDLYNNVPSVGHCHPLVVEAVARQMARLNTNTRYLYDNVHDYAERLLATFPDPLSNVVFTCTGSEANDLALRIARIATGGEGFVVTDTAYHGNTAAVTAVSPASLKDRSALPAHVRAVPPPAARQAGEDCGQCFATAVSAAIDDLERCNIRFAGLLVDSIFSSDGIFAEPRGLLAPAAALTRERGGVFIADEVQPGFGRTGNAFWGFARHGVTPDIATLGKPMGNGYPIGGVVTRPDMLERFATSVDYFNTFGGSPCAAAAGLAVLEVIERERLTDNAEMVGGYLQTELGALKSRFPAISDIRGAGLFLGVEFGDAVMSGPALASFVVDALRHRGVLIGIAGSGGDTLKIRPPLTFARDDADLFLSALRDVLAEAATS